jgi:hypothetical protein
LERFCSKQGRTKGIKDFLSVLMLYQAHSAEDIEAAVDQALTAGVSCSGAIEHILLNANTPAHEFETLDKWDVLPPADVSVYARIGGDV